MPKRRSTFAYVFRAGEYFKVGRAGVWQYRLTDIRVGCPFEVVPFAIFDFSGEREFMAYHAERDIQARFAEWWVRGEWFRLPDQAQAWLLSDDNPYSAYRVHPHAPEGE